MTYDGFILRVAGLFMVFAIINYKLNDNDLIGFGLWSAVFSVGMLICGALFAVYDMVKFIWEKF